MADSSDRLLAKLAALNDTLDDLEDKLEPLLSQTLPESLLPLETIQQVKLNVALPYLVYDLIFIYLKTRGIDPKTHPVVAELDRVRQYFEKIKNAEDPEKRKTAVDKAAANRFIKHAIAQAKEQRAPGDAQSGSVGAPGGSGPSGHAHIRFDEDGNAPSGSASPALSTKPGAAATATIPVKMTSKMLARAEYQKQLADGAVLSDEEDEDMDALQVFDNQNENEAGDEQPGQLSSKMKGKSRAVDEEPVSASDTLTAEGKKRRRPAMDPFAGYGEEEAAKPAKSKPSKKKKSAPSPTDGEDTTANASASGTATPKSAKDKTAAKKTKKKTKKVS